CVSYNPYNCWYKQVFSTSISPLSLRVDRQRLDVLLAAIVFDDNRMIVDMPSWEALVEAFNQLPVLDPPAASEPAGEEAVQREWRQMIALESIAGPETGEAVFEPPAAEARSFASLADPCGDCEAYCCTHLIFPQPTPLNAA